MVFRFSANSKAQKNLLQSPKALDVPKGHFAVYAGESQKKRFVVPICLLKEPTFQDLLSQSEEEYGYYYPMGGVTISCCENIFVDLISRLNV